MKKEIPVYLFTGFLGAGKTTFIQDTLESEDFLTEECTLFLVCEEGEVEYEPKKFYDSDIHIEVVENEADLTTEYMDKMADKYDADAVIVCMMKFCDPEEFDYPILLLQFEEAGVKHIQVEIDQESTSFEQLRTRIQTFAEVL